MVMEKVNLHDCEVICRWSLEFQELSSTLIWHVSHVNIYPPPRKSSLFSKESRH